MLIRCFFWKIFVWTKLLEHYEGRFACYSFCCNLCSISLDIWWLIDVIGITNNSKSQSRWNFYLKVPFCFITVDGGCRASLEAHPRWVGFSKPGEFCDPCYIPAVTGGHLNNHRLIDPGLPKILACEGLKVRFYYLTLWEVPEHVVWYMICYKKCITFELLKLKICNFSTSSFFNREKNQACFETRACRWSVGSWSNCSDGCGLGFRSRQVTCAGAFWIGEPCQTSRVDWMN